MKITLLLISLAASSVLSGSSPFCPDGTVVQQWVRVVKLFQSELIAMARKTLIVGRFEEFKNLNKSEDIIAYLKQYGSLELQAAWDKHMGKPEHNATATGEKIIWALLLDTMHAAKLSTFALASSACANKTGTAFPASGKIPCSCEQEGRGSVTLSADAPDDSPDGCMPSKCDCGGGVSFGPRYMMYNFLTCLAN